MFVYGLYPAVVVNGGETSPIAVTFIVIMAIAIVYFLYKKRRNK